MGGNNEKEEGDKQLSEKKKSKNTNKYRIKKYMNFLEERKRQSQISLIAYMMTEKKERKLPCEFYKADQTKSA